jgi:hypothetical protein
MKAVCGNNFAVAYTQATVYRSRPQSDQSKVTFTVMELFFIGKSSTANIV